jgi:hypothetical protein
MYETHSGSLVKEYDAMVQWKERGYEEMNQTEVRDEWRCIMDQIENGNKRVQICLGTGEEMPSFKEAAMVYVREVVYHLEEALGIPVDAYTPPVQL